MHEVSSVSSAVSRSGGRRFLRFCIACHDHSQDSIGKDWQGTGLNGFSGFRFRVYCRVLSGAQAFWLEGSPLLDLLPHTADLDDFKTLNPETLNRYPYLLLAVIILLLTP